jgi:uncharacterized membrane protein YeiH
VIIYLLDLFGTAVFAVTGALIAGHKRMDIFGVVVVAVVTAIGGGTMRDVVLGATPVFWVDDARYLIVSVAAALVTFVAAPSVNRQRHVLLIADAFGLAIFTVIGAERALAADVHPMIAVVMGVMTGVAGGIARDVLCGEVPLILKKEIYATASLLGGVVFVFMATARLGDLAVLCAVAVVLIVRLAAIRWNLSLPVLDHTRSPEDGSE